jgi:hypothetical protein
VSNSASSDPRLGQFKLGQFQQLWQPMGGNCTMSVVGYRTPGLECIP